MDSNGVLAVVVVPVVLEPLEMAENGGIGSNPTSMVKVQVLSYRWLDQDLGDGGGDLAGGGSLVLLHLLPAQVVVDGGGGGPGFNQLRI